MKFEIKNSYDQKIVGILDKPEGEGPFPAVIVCPGLKGYKEQTHLSTLAEELVKQGIVSIRIDGTNNVGESDGDVIDVSTVHYVGDIKAAIDYAETLEFVDSDKIGLIGHSLGGMAIILEASEDERVKALAPMGAVFDGKEIWDAKYDIDEWEKIGYVEQTSKVTGITWKVGFQLYSELEFIDMEAAVKKIKVPIYFVHGDEDEAVPYHQAQDMLKISQDAELLTLEGYIHCWRTEEEGHFVGEKIASWLSKHL